MQRRFKWMRSGSVILAALLLVPLVSSGHHHAVDAVVRALRGDCRPLGPTVAVVVPAMFELALVVQTAVTALQSRASG
jgi:hypothetical protein